MLTSLLRRTLTAAALTTSLLLVPAAAQAQTGCLRTVTVAGGNAYAVKNGVAYARNASTATLCVIYSRAYGYSFRSGSCGVTSARLQNLSLSFRNPKVISCAFSSNRSIYTSSSGMWRWDRTYPVTNECAFTVVSSSWAINAANGTISHTGTTTTNGALTPYSWC